MKRHPAMAASICPGSKGESPESLATQIAAARPPTGTVQHLELTAGALPARASGRPRPASKRAMHTLLLSGSLDRSSTYTLEAEIERLCESGVRELTLDLAQLAGIDFTGAAVIAFRRKWCGRRGCELSVVGGTPEIRLAFTAAGVGELFCDEHADASVDAPDAALDAQDARSAPSDAPMSTAASAPNDESARTIAAITPPTEAGTRIVARRADDDPCAPAPGTGAPATPIEEAAAATV